MASNSSCSIFRNIRIPSLLMVLGILAVTPSVWAHTTPDDSNSTGVGLTLTAFRCTDPTDITTCTPIAGGVVTGETIHYGCTLSALNAQGGGVIQNAAVELGAISITDPGGTTTDATPAGGVPCLCPADDVCANDPTPPPGAACEGADAAFVSDLVAYEVDCAAAVSGVLAATCAYADGIAHLGENDTSPINAATPLNLECITCDVTLTKEASCAGGAFGDNVACWNAFDAMPAEDLTVRYVAENISDPGITLQNCALTDTNGEIIDGSITAGDGAIGEGETETQDVTNACSDTLDAGEPDTGTVTCDCFLGETDLGVNATATDTSNFECLTPGLSVTKDCSPQEGTDNAVEIQVANTGDAVLENCVVNDQIFGDDPTCPPVNAATGDINGTLSANNFNLDPNDQNPGGTDEMTVTGTVSGLTDDACNQVTVTCDVSGADKTIENTADDLCEAAGAGCFTRTPGYWMNHPEITAQFLPLEETCGFTVMNAPEALQDMCVNGREAKQNQTTQTHLQLLRQCTAAMININATAAAEGNCETEFPGITNTVATCCLSNLCEQDHGAVAASGCIEALDAFNNEDFDGEELDAPFGDMPADPSLCQDASKDGQLNPRNLGGK